MQNAKATAWGAGIMGGEGARNDPSLTPSV